MTDRARRAGFRPDIQALRALAIGSVVVYHLQPGRLSGGYLGVDLFFVISGFLITSHLLRDSAGGVLSLRRFWARRIRRLLPASLTVLVLAGIGVALWVPARLWEQFFGEVAASAFYVENWYLAGTSVDYLGKTNPPSPVQHYWSLSGEEQFYIVWPILIALTLLVLHAARRTGRTRLVLGIVLAVVTVASFAWAVHDTAESPASSFFVSTTRAWEFGAGSLLAFAPDILSRIRMPRIVIGLLGWLGWLVAIACMFRFTSHTPHPGWPTLIPVGAGVLLIATGGVPSRLSPRVITSLPPLQWIGNWSYSIYVWHWPLIVLVPYALHEDELTTVQKLVIVVASLALGALSYRFIEQRGLKLPLAPRGRLLPWYAGALVIGLVIVGGSVGAVGGQNAAQAAAAQAAAQRAAANPECLGAGSLVDPTGCAGIFDGAVLVPGTATAAKDSDSRLTGCIAGLTSAFKPCSYTGGDGSGQSVAVVGDSHMAHLAPLFYALADEYDWNLTIILKNGCPFMDASRDVDADDQAACAAWNPKAVSYLADHRIQLVLTSQMAGVGFVATVGQTKNQTATAGLVRTWKQVVAGGARIIAFRDVPRGVSGELACVEKNYPSDIDKCTSPLSDAFAFDPQVDAAKKFSSSQVTLADLTPLYCTATGCPAVIGGVDLYRDSNGHLTATYARTEIPYVQKYLPVDWLAARG